MVRAILLVICLSFISLIPWSVNFVSAQDEPTITVSDIPPTPGETPEETLDKCLQWYMEAHPVPYTKVYWECHEIVGYWGILAFTAVDGMEEGYESGTIYNVDGTIGEETDRTIQLASFYLNSIYSRQPSNYQLIIEGFERCIEPTLSIDPERYAIDVGESTPIVLHLFCNTEPMGMKNIELEVVSGPGELELPPYDDVTGRGQMDPSSIENLIKTGWDGRCEATLTATGSGVIEVRATRRNCQDRDNPSEDVQTVEIRAGKWVSIDCTYSSDPGRFGDDALIWGGTVHAEVMLETIEEEVYGYPVTRLGGRGSGSQECWVETSGPDWIENISCPEFTAEVVSGMVWPDAYNFMLDASDTANLTFDIVYNEGDSRLTRSELDPVRAIETPIALGFDPDAVFTVTDTDVLGTEYTVEARWME